MPQFHYRALSRSGEPLSGSIDAHTPRDAIAKVQAMGHLPISASQEGLAKVKADWRLRAAELIAAKPTTREVALFTNQMSSLVASGLTVDRALAVQAGAATSKPMQEMVQELRRRVRTGEALSQGLQRFPGCFPRFYWATVQAAEQGGFLDIAFRRLATFVARSDALRASVQSALVYPTVLMVMAAASILVILTFVIPQFRPIIEDSGVAPTWSLSLLLAGSWLLEEHAGLILLATVGAATLGAFAYRRLTRAGWVDRVALRLPVVKDIAVGLDVGRFARTLGMLIENGVPLPAGLELAAASVRNSRIRVITANATRTVKEGGRLAAALGDPVLPQVVAELIKVGEETGKLPELLTQAADIVDQDVQRLLERLMAMLVPVLTIFLGLIVAGLVASILSALLSINQMVA